MDITKEQVLDIYGTTGNLYLHSKLTKWFPDAFKVELEVGKVYKFGVKFMFKFAGKYSTSCDSGAYGFGTTGKWSENLGVDKEDNYTEATTEEWESALIAEAKKRGYKNGNYECLSNFGSDVVVTDEYSFDTYEYLHQGEIDGDTNIIFKDGVWADIIRTISKEEAENQLGCKII